MLSLNGEMRVAVCYPPLLYRGRVPVLTQSRIFSFTHSSEIRIYPLVMAQAATLLKADGHGVSWLDGISAGEGLDGWWTRFGAVAPDLAVVETKVTMIRRHWAFIDELKARFPATRVILVGDHVSYFPEESAGACAVDYIVAGGDYDLGIRAIARFEAGEAIDLPAGVWARGRSAGAEPPALDADVDALPWIDRELTKFNGYGEAYLHRPVAYILSGRGCGGIKAVGRCTFCIWQYAFWRKTARLRDPRNVAAEIKHLVDRYGVREVFDDNEAGGMWDLPWLTAFTEELERLDVAGKVHISSNCRADSVTPDRVELMKRAGYRMLKIALESGNDETLRQLAKDETVEEIVRGVKLAKDAGFAVMVTTMIGFPWETDADVRRTYEVAKDLLLYRAHRGDCLEANVVIPYPGTPLHKTMLDRGWFTIDPMDYEAYGLSKPVVTSPADPIAWGRKLWRLHRHPLFVARSALSVRSVHDLTLGWRGLRSLLGHERDYTAVPAGAQAVEPA